MRKLVARKTKDYEASILILLIKVLQTIVLRGESAFGSGVDYQKDIPFIFREVHLDALVAQGLEIINRCHYIYKLYRSRCKYTTIILYRKRYFKKKGIFAFIKLSHIPSL